MRQLKEKIIIIEDDVKVFFDQKAQNDANSSLSTMLQQNPHVSTQRDIIEKEFMRGEPLIAQASKVLDLGCGNGRLCSVFAKLENYDGIDLSQVLIQKAKDSFFDNKFSFHTASIKNIKNIDKINKSKYDLVMISGLLIYLNDQDIPILFENIESLCEKSCLIYIREPISILDERLSLKDHYSEELNSLYSAIYRTEKELNVYFKSFEKYNFKIYKSDFMYKEDLLNNRTETIQKYYLLKR